MVDILPYSVISVSRHLFIEVPCFQGYQYRKHFHRGQAHISTTVQRRLCKACHTGLGDQALAGCQVVMRCSLFHRHILPFKGRLVKQGEAGIGNLESGT